jgi:hypothetical protein
VSSKRRNRVLGAYGIAVWSTLGFFISIIAAAAVAEDRQTAEVVGNAMGVLVFLPALAGLGLGFSSIDRNLVNPWWVWGAAVWNALIVVGFVLLLVIGTLAG